jgi:hypothetical protein
VVARQGEFSVAVSASTLKLTETTADNVPTSVQNRRAAGVANAAAPAAANSFAILEEAQGSAVHLIRIVPIRDSAATLTRHHAADSASPTTVSVAILKMDSAAVHLIRIVPVSDSAAHSMRQHAADSVSPPTVRRVRFSALEPVGAKPQLQGALSLMSAVELYHSAARVLKLACALQVWKVP